MLKHRMWASGLYLYKRAMFVGTEVPVRARRPLLFILRSPDSSVTSGCSSCCQRRLLPRWGSLWHCFCTGPTGSRHQGTQTPEKSYANRQHGGCLPRNARPPQPPEWEGSTGEKDTGVSAYGSPPQKEEKEQVCKTPGDNSAIRPC